MVSGNAGAMPQAKTPMPRSTPAATGTQRRHESVTSPDYVPSRGDETSPAILQNADGPLACQTAIGMLHREQ